MYCPKCKGHTVVRDSRSNISNVTTRKRQCTTCEKRFTTLELPIEEMKGYLKKKRKK